MRDPVLPVPPTGGRLRRGLRAFVGALSDDELARRAGDGDEQAFAALFRRRADHLQAIAQRVLRDPDDARDAVQSALMKGLLAIRRGQLRGDVRPWMSRICLHEAISVLRVRTPWIELDERQHVAVERSPEAALLLREQLQAVAADLLVLPERQRRAFLLREVAELPYDRVCALLELRPDAARQAVREARVALRELAEGREEQCAVVRAILADADGRTRRSRRLRGHLRACEGCRSWERARRPAAPRRLAALLLGAWLPKLLVGSAASTVSAGQLPTVAAVVAIAGGSGALPVLTSPPAPRHPAASTAQPRDGDRGDADGRDRAAAPSTGAGVPAAAGSPAAGSRPVLRLAVRRTRAGAAAGGRIAGREQAGASHDRLGVDGAREPGGAGPASAGSAGAERSPGARRTGAPRPDAAAGSGAASRRPGSRSERPASDASATGGDGAPTSGAARRPGATTVTGAALNGATRRLPAAAPDDDAADATPSADGGAQAAAEDGNAQPSAAEPDAQERD